MAATPPAQSVTWLRGPLRPFRTGQYRLLAAALTMSLFAAGGWLIAVVWQVIALGGGPRELSFASTAFAVGMLVATLPGGVLADRIPQLRILVGVAALRTVTVALVAGLAVAGWLDLWHLVVAAFLCGCGNGLTYPAYSALLPSILPADDLLPANGVEASLRPTIMQAAGPALASALIAAWSPGIALIMVAAFEAAGMVLLLTMRPVPLRHDRTKDDTHPIRSTFVDLKDGFVYMARTPWLLATLLFASLLILLIMGPIEVLIPFVVKDRVGGGPGDHAVVMAAYGIGGAVGSLAMASWRMPRRYLTVMNLFWGFGCAPLAVVGVATQLPLIVVATFIVGIFFAAPMVIWGTLLQRRVPPALLGRVSSLDFFVSLVFMPVSMAVAGPVSAEVGLRTTFLVAGLIPPIVGLIAIVWAKMPKDELANPLDTTQREGLTAPTCEAQAAPPV
ncbi:MAG TPA: MFS transporter [Actinopolymorphaceae bacterium]|jgi:MFS family permease